MRFVVATLMPITAVGVVFAPAAAAACNDSSGTTVCAQGDIRGTHAPAPGRYAVGPVWGTWCRSGFCYGGFGTAISLGP